MAAPLAGQGCILGLICIPSSPSPTADPDPDPDVNTDVNTDAHALVEPAVGQPNGRGADPKPRAQPAAAATVVGDAAVRPGFACPGNCRPGLSDRQPDRHARRQRRRTPLTPAGLVASDATAVLTAGTANITGFHYVGNVNVPTAAGTQQMMEFTADSIDLSGTVTVTVTQDGTTATTVSATQDFSDGVTLYATKLSGSLQAVSGLPGVPLTFAPSTIGVSLLNLPNIGELQLANLVTGAIPLTLTGVTTDQLLISSGTQVTTQLSMS